MKKAFATGLIAIAALNPNWASADDALNIAVGAEYTSGKYGSATSTDVWLYPVTATYQHGNSSFSLIVPYMRISGPSNVIGAVGNKFQMNMMNTGTNVTQRTTAGLGDVVFAATQTLYADQQSGWTFDVAGNIKFGTASTTNGLGTGKNDYSLQGDFAKTFESVDMFGTLGWRKMGNTDGITFKNHWFTTDGAGYSVSQTTRVGLAYNFRQRVIDGTSNFSDLLAFTNYSVSDQTRIQMYLLKGYTDNSPDRGFGGSLNWGF